MNVPSWNESRISNGSLVIAMGADGWGGVSEAGQKVTAADGFESVTNRVPVDAQAQQFMELNVKLN